MAMMTTVLSGGLSYPCSVSVSQSARPRIARFTAFMVLSRGRIKFSTISFANSFVFLSLSPFACSSFPELVLSSRRLVGEKFAPNRIPRSPASLNSLHLTVAALIRRVPRRPRTRFQRNSCKSNSKSGSKVLDLLSCYISLRTYYFSRRGCFDDFIK